MSILTLNDILQEMRDATGRDDKDTAFIRGVNNALYELILKVRMKEFHLTTAFSCVVDKADYAFASNEFAVFTVKDLDNDVVLSSREITQLDDISDDLTSGEGAPTKWSIWETNIILYDKVPDDTYSMRRRGLKRPARLAAGTDAPTIQDEWDDLLVVLSISKAFLAIGEVDDAAKYRTQLDALIVGRETPEQARKEHTGDQGFIFSDFSQK